MSNKLKVVNIFGGPGTGKSTTAAYLFHELKCAGKNVELVTEYAKDMVWEGRMNVLSDQLYMAAKQNRKLERLVNHGLEVAITDSPLILGALYQPPGYYELFEPFLVEVFNSYNNLNIYLKRSTEYNPLGRNQTLEEAIVIDEQNLKLLDKHDIAVNIIVDLTVPDWKEQLLSQIQWWAEQP
ncbi:hypothetical protein D3C75_652800 [compost metagenome]